MPWWAAVNRRASTFSNYFLPASQQVTAGTLLEAKKQVLYWLGGAFSLSSLTSLIIAFVLYLAIRGIKPADAPGS